MQELLSILLGTDPDSLAGFGESPLQTRVVSKRRETQKAG